MAARKPTTKEGGKKKTASKADKPKNPTPAKQTKHVKEKTTKPTTSKKISKGKVMKVCKVKRTNHLVDEAREEHQLASEIPVEDDEYNLQRGIQISLESFQALVGEWLFVNQPQGSLKDFQLLKRQTPATKDASAGPSTQPQDDTSANVADTEILSVGVEQGEDVSNTVALEDRTVKLDAGQAGSDPKKICANFEKKHKLQDKTVQALSSRVFTLENHDMHSKIDSYVNETVKEAVQNTLQAPIYDVHISDSEDTDAAHLLKIKTRPDWLKPVPEEEMPKTPKPERVIPPNELLETKNNWADALAKTYKDPDENKLLQKTRDIGSFIKWYCKQIGKSKLVKADLEGPAYKLVKPFHKNNISLQYQMEECHLLLTDQIDLVTPEGNQVVPDVSKPLPLGGPLGDKERRNALSISKLKAAYYPDFGLEEFVLSLWIKSEHDYDISVAYGISQWWFKRKEFYITRHSAPFDHRAVRSHMRILSVTSLKTFSRYGYTFLKEIVL
ncbi:hypothetical protein Tco_0861163 [Tanacetum coccineum]|uniref:Uncharacterized protein n=1 Tax=Tanacetum coccineum TaxID=301880 RepID=A0ABQ5BH05_9ASTR